MTEKLIHAWETKLGKLWLAYYCSYTCAIWSKDDIVTLTPHATMGLFRRNEQEQNPTRNGDLTLHLDVDSHTLGIDSRKKLSQSLTEPLYEVRDPHSGRRYAPCPAPSYYGPHFEKGPSQEEIWNTRQRKEIWRSEKKMDEAVFRDEYCRRAHTFQQPARQHQYSTPYEVRPLPWTNQMSAEYDEYKLLEQENEINRSGVKDAWKARVGRNHVPTVDHGRAIEAGISHANAGRIGANQ